MACERHCKPHAIMISLPYQGHITPFVNLALKIASKGFTITFVHIEFIHQLLTKANNNDDVHFFSEAIKLGLDIRYTTISDGFPVDFDRVLHREEYWQSVFQDFPTRVDEFVGKIIEADPSLIPFLVVDTLYSWPATIAKKYNLVNVSFWTEPALVFSIDYHLDLLRENGHFPCKDYIEEEINYLPGVESISTRDLMSYLKEAETTNITREVATRGFEEVKKADFILHNTVYELESITLSALNKNQPNYAVGPINFSQNLDITSVSKSLSLWPESDCTEFLDRKTTGSVLYVSFGSLVQVSKQVIEEIAYGLLLSEVNFIWVVRADRADVLPIGFEDESEGRGLIIPWCNQIKVLSNPGVGAFLTHCGWNSILESIWCGVPMICYPLSFDQPTNRKLLVDDWNIGINLSDHGMPIHRREVAEKIKSFMNGQGLKQDIKKLNAILQNALKTEGSSCINFDQFIKDLKIKICAPDDDDNLNSWY